METRREIAVDRKQLGESLAYWAEGPALQREDDETNWTILMEAGQRMLDLIVLVDEQAADGGIWFVAATAPENYLQQELRRLHAAVEGAKWTI